MLEIYGGYMGKKTGSMQISRRDFLKLSAFTTTAAMGLTGMGGILESTAGQVRECSPRALSTGHSGERD